MTIGRKAKGFRCRVDSAVRGLLELTFLSRIIRYESKAWYQHYRKAIRAWNSKGDEDEPLVVIGAGWGARPSC